MAKKEKKVKTPTYQVTIEQLKAYDQRGYERGRKEAFDYLMAISLIVLRDFFGFGGARLEKFIDGVYEYYESITKKLVDIDEIIEAIKDETGIEIMKRWVELSKSWVTNENELFPKMQELSRRRKWTYQK